VLEALSPEERQESKGTEMLIGAGRGSGAGKGKGRGERVVK
jgi:hypothetical protein